MAERLLYLVRHGQYETQKNATPLEWLTDYGKLQAARTGKALSAYPISAIHASSHLRALETAQLLGDSLPDIPLYPTETLWECFPSIPMNDLQKWMDGTSAESLRYRLFAEPAFREEMSGKVRETYRLAEDTLETGLRRVEGVIEQFFQPVTETRHEVLVCHGNLIRALACQALEVDVSAWLNMRCHHCGITRILIEEDGKRYLLSFNETGHLPLHLKTEF